MMRGAGGKLGAAFHAAVICEIFTPPLRGRWLRWMCCGLLALVAIVLPLGLAEVVKRLDR